MADLLDNRIFPLKHEQTNPFIVLTKFFARLHLATFGACSVPDPVDPLPLADVARFRLRQGGVPAALDVVARDFFAAGEPLLEIFDAVLSTILRRNCSRNYKRLFSWGGIIRKCEPYHVGLPVVAAIAVPKADERGEIVRGSGSETEPWLIETGGAVSDPGVERGQGGHVEAEEEAEKEAE